MSPTIVSVVGCGIAGPILAVFLKLKGYDPVLFDRLDGVTEAGLSLMLQPNGLKVLGLIPGLINRLPGRNIERNLFYSTISKEVLADDDMPAGLAEKYGYGMIGVHRTSFHRLLVDVVEEHGVKVHWGHQLDSIEEGEQDVTLTFKNGAIHKSSFAISCEGLHSRSRIALFGEEKPDFTGLVQTGGLSPTPAVLAAKASMTNMFGIGAHLITYPVSDTRSSWAVSSQEPEAKESWRSMDANGQAEFKRDHSSDWSFGGDDLIKNAEKIVKYGLYDRPELKKWYKGRVALLGDAAHPTTPHLGQGANQAFEDVYHLIRALTAHNPDANSPPSTACLEAAFADYEAVRLPRTSALVKGARSRGMVRVVPDVESAKKRDEAVKERFQSREEMASDYEYIASGPFQGQSEI